MTQMKIEDFGYNQKFKEYRTDNNLNSFGIGRVISEHKDRYIVKNETTELDAELLGNLRFSAESRNDLPAVGDWVAISEYDENKALIHTVFPRFSKIERKTVGKSGQTQIIATNIDFGLIVQSVNRDYNINRLERYLTICNSSKIEPIIVLSKIDLIEEAELKSLINDIKERIKNIQIISISNPSQIGIEEIKNKMIKGRTYCLLGSSGVGKSTLINSLIGKKMMNTGQISQSIDRGKHVTTHRELIILENGILIDNPGMREVGITSSSEALEMTFDEIMRLTQDCKFSDCSHTNENNCAIINAIENEGLDLESYDNFQKMEKERAFFESSQKEKKQKDKNLGKLIRQNQKKRRSDKY